MSDNYNPNEHDQTTFNTEQKNKLNQLINEGMSVMNEVETLNAGLSDTIKAVAEEMNIKATVLKKAIKIAHKMEFGQTQRDHELLENILTTVGKTL
jgi:phage host-nuclease inhibitor protein Gam